MSSKKKSPGKPKSNRSRDSLLGGTVPDAAAAQADGLTSVSNVKVGSYLAEPDGVRLRPEQQSPQVRAL